MLIILLIIVIGIVSFLQVFRSKTSNASYYILAILWMLFPALRTEYVGTDTINYLGFFLQPKSGYNGKEIFEIEPGFVMWNYLVAFVSTNIYFYLFSSSVLSCSVKILVFKKLSPYPLFSLFLFSVLVTLEPLLFSEYGPIRQAISVGFYMLFVWGLMIHTKKMAIWSILFAVLSILFHGSSVFPVFITIILRLFKVNFIISKKKLVVILLASLFGGNLILIYGKTVVSLLSFLAIQQLGYLDSMYDAVWFDGYGYYRNTLPLVLMSLFIIKFQKNTDDLIFKLSIWGVIFTNLFIQIPIGQRITYCFMPILCIAISRLVNKKNLIYLVPIILFEFWRLYGYYVSQSSGIQSFGDGNVIFPYTSILNF